MRKVLVMLEVNDETAIEKDLGTIEYIEKEIDCLRKNGIILANARILDEDDKEDENAIEAANQIFEEEFN